MRAQNSAILPNPDNVLFAASSTARRWLRMHEPSKACSSHDMSACKQQLVREQLARVRYSRQGALERWNTTDVIWKEIYCCRRLRGVPADALQVVMAVNVLQQTTAAVPQETRKS
jgi:hypothetical protein